MPKNKNPSTRQVPRVETIYQSNRNWRGGELSEAGHQHDLANVERAMASRDGEEHRHEVDGSKKSSARYETQHTTNGKASMTKYPKIDKGLRRSEHSASPSRDGKNADDQQANDQR